MQKKSVVKMLRKSIHSNNFLSEKNIIESSLQADIEYVNPFEAGKHNAMYITASSVSLIKYHYNIAATIKDNSKGTFLCLLNKYHFFLIMKGIFK